MTRQARKRFLIAATVISQIILLIHLLVIIYIYFAQQQFMDTEIYSTIFPSGNLNMLMLNLALQGAVSSGALLGLYFFFRKTPSAEVFFFEFALLGFSLSTLRILAVPLALQITSLFALQPLSKLLFFGRFFAVLSLFFSGLFSTGLAYQKQGGYLLIEFIIALILSTVLPLDCTLFDPPLICRLGQGSGFGIAYYVIGAIAMLNYLYASALHSSRDYVFNAISILLVFSGMELSYHCAHIPAGLFGALLVITGTVLFAHRTHAIYQWF